MTPLPITQLQQHPTPYYAYSLSLLDQTITQALQAASNPHTNPFDIHYAVKANPNPTLLARIASRGLGADCVSAGEIKAALQAGFPPQKIVLAGVGKTDAEIQYALQTGIQCLNIESLEELQVTSDIATQMGLTAPVALRINPNIDAHTHRHITTGLAENKFGIDIQNLLPAIQTALNLPSLHLIGLHFHIGSQLTDLQPYQQLCQRINQIQTELLQNHINLPSINVGGGLGIDYDNPDQNPIPDFQQYFDTFRQNLHLHPGQTLHFELGRSIVGQCGTLISRCTYIKQGLAKQFLILDAGMTELIRPALYGAHHLIQNLTAPTTAPTATYDIVGPICETSDTFATAATLPQTHRGDLIAIRSAGAYGEAMSSHYNCRTLNPPLYIQ